MINLNMAKMNTLFRKWYLLAGVIIAANMFVVNEVKAMNKEELTNNDPTQQEHEDGKQEKSDSSWKRYVKSSLGFLSSYENPINFIGGSLSSVANNYLKLWDYNPGWYCNLRIGCLGLRSKRFLNGMLQFEINLNLIRGALWLIPGSYIFMYEFTKDGKKEDHDDKYIENLHFSFLVHEKVYNSSRNEFLGVSALIVFFLLQGFVSMPLTLHFSKFSISISLDSILWGVAGFFLAEKEEQPKKENPNNNDLKKSQEINNFNEYQKAEENINDNESDKDESDNKKENNENDNELKESE